MKASRHHAVSRRTWLALFMPLGLASLLSVLLAWVLYAAPLGVVVRLDRGSMRPTRPDIATSGEYVAIVWSDGYIPTAAGQGYVYLSSATETDGGWPRLRVYPSSASAENLAKEPAVAFGPGANSSQIHMAWSQHTGTGQVFNQISYASCSLANRSTCASVSPATVRSSTQNVFMPDIAVDKNGAPHVVWVEGSGTNTVIRYAKGPTWTPVLISPSSPYTATQPAIAYADVGSDGCLHIVWAGSNLIGSDMEHIGYKRIDLSGSSCGGDKGPIYFNQDSPHSNPKNPRVAAAGDSVYIVWDIDSGSPSGEYDQYYLVYNYSLDGGETWARPDGADPEYLDFPSGGSAAFTPHLSLDETLSGRTLYGSRLRPDVTLEITGTSTIIPHLVWSEAITDGVEGLDYHFDVFHTTSQSGNWVMPGANLSSGEKLSGSNQGVDSGAPVVAVGKDGHVHTAYLETQSSYPVYWDFTLYQGPIEDHTAEIYLPVIMKNSG